MIQKFFPVMMVALIAVGCVPKDNFSSYPGTTTGTTAGTTTTTGGTSYASCSALSAYTSLALCKSSTFAQCYPSTKIIQNQTAVCYFPVTGWESCATNQAAWSYGSYGNYCMESTGVYLRTRTATCTRSVAACDCITDSVTSDRCSIGNTLYSTCGFTYTGGISACSGSATPTPTPTSTPSWCSRTFLNYQVGGNNSETVLRNANSSRFSQIRSFFSNRGYGVTNIRGSTYSLSSLGPLLDTDRASAYVVQVEASSSGCFIGSHINMTVRLLKGGNEISSGSESTACVSFGDEVGRAVDRALDRMNAPNCQ